MSLSELQGINVRFVEDTADCLDFITWLGQRRPILAIDTETTGLQWWTPNFTRLVQFGDGGGGWALDAVRWRGTIMEALDKLREMHEPTAWWNVNFDRHALESDGFGFVDPRKAHDGKIMHHLLDNTANHSLKPVSDTFWPGASGGQQLLRRTFAKNGWTWATVPVDHPHYWAYGVMDTVLTCKLVEDKLWPNLAPYDEPYQIEMAVIDILYRAECRGMRINPDYTGRLLTAWCDEADILKEELLAYGIAKPGSNKAVTAALEIEGWEPEEWTETGLPKLDKVVLAELIAASGVPAEIASRVLRYKRLVKWSQNYLVKFLRDRTEGDHVHASINTMAARTGRMSVTGIALQTLPRGPEVRHCVIPEDGDMLYAIDYDGQEARQFAALSQDPGFIAAANSLDLHRYTAALAYGKAEDDVSDHERGVAKNFRYSQMYGAGDEKMAQTGGVSVETVAEFRRLSDAAFPGIPRFLKEVEEVGRQRLITEGRAYVRSLGGRHISCEPDKLYKLVNCLIQGSAADLLKHKIVALDAAGLADNIVVPVHDELLFTFPADMAADMAATAKEIMEDHTSYIVPLTCSVTGPLPTWGTKYEH